jgi:hypothetical protein
MATRVPRLPGVVLFARYVDQRQSPETIAADLGVSRETVRRWLAHYGIERRPVGSGEHHPTGPRTSQRSTWPDEATLRSFYFDHGWSMRRLASHFDVATGTIANWFRAYGITPKEPTADGRHLWTPDAFPETNNRPPLCPRPDTKLGYEVRYRRQVFGVEGRPRRCERCGSTYRIEVHHRDEDRSNNTSSNLEVLCKRCHRKHHAVSKS